MLPHLVETMAELVAEPPLLLRPDQAAQHYEEAVAVAVEACAADTGIEVSLQNARAALAAGESPPPPSA